MLLARSEADPAHCQTMSYRSCWPTTMTISGACSWRSSIFSLETIVDCVPVLRHMYRVCASSLLPPYVSPALSHHQLNSWTLWRVWHGHRRGRTLLKWPIGLLKWLIPSNPQASYSSWCMFALQTGLQIKTFICLAYDDIDECLLTDPSWHHLATYAAFPSHAM